MAVGQRVERRVVDEHVADGQQQLPTDHGVDERAAARDRARRHRQRRGRRRPADRDRDAADERDEGQVQRNEPDAEQARRDHAVLRLEAQQRQARNHVREAEAGEPPARCDFGVARGALVEHEHAEQRQDCGVPHHDQGRG